MRKTLTAIYTRVSSRQQKDDETIDSQLDILISYANQNGFEVPKDWIFKDDGYSGSTLDRPGLDELRDLVREHAIDVVLVYSPDRLARRYVNQLILEEEFSKHAVKLIYIKGCKDETPEDQLLKHFQGIFAEYERSQILDRSRRGKLYKARQGDKNILAKAPYGYSSCRENFFAIDLQKATIVKEIFNLYIKEEYSLRAIAKHLSEKNIASPTGSKNWCPTTIRGILNNPAYTGTAYYGKTEKGECKTNRIARYSSLGKVVKAKSPKRDKPKEEWYPISVPVIIHESDFESAQYYLQKNKEFSLRNTKVPSILQGVLVCGICGRSYYKRLYGKNGKKWCSYYCHSQLDRGMQWCGNGRINQNDLDNIVWEKVIKLIEHPELIEEEIERRVSENPKKKELDNREQEIQKEIKKIKHAQDKLLDAYQETECLEINELKARLQKLKSHEKELKKELDYLQAISIANEKRVSLELTIEEFRLQLLENAKDLSIEKKQKIIRGLIDEVIIMPGEITINHTISLNRNRSCQLSSACGLHRFRDVFCGFGHVMSIEPIC